ncbi:MAG: hypothetical protein ACRDHM_00635 [Actinomycetota bacterium]
MILLIAGVVAYGLTALLSYYPAVLEILSITCSEEQPNRLRAARPDEPRWQPLPPGWVCDYHLPDGRTVTLDLDDLKTS